MKTAQKSILWNILRITGNLLYIVAPFLFWVIMVFAFGFEAIDFGPDYIIPEGNGPNTLRDIFVMSDILVYPLLLFSLTNKTCERASKFMKGYSVFWNSYNVGGDGVGNFRASICSLVHSFACNSNYFCDSNANSCNLPYSFTKNQVFI